MVGFPYKHFIPRHVCKNLKQPPWALCMTSAHGPHLPCWMASSAVGQKKMTAIQMLILLFFVFHGATCHPEQRILYPVTKSYKGPISVKERTLLTFVAVEV